MREGPFEGINFAWRLLRHRRSTWTEARAVKAAVRLEQLKKLGQRAARAEDLVTN